MTELVRYEAARHALQAAVHVDEVKDIRDKAAAMAAYAKQAQDTELQQWATEIKVRAERRAGELLREMPKATGGQPYQSTGTPEVPVENEKPVPTLADLGISKNESSRWQKLAAVSETDFEKAVTAAKEVAGEVTAQVIIAVHNHRAQGTGENEWYTPSEFVESARRVLGAFDLDPASSEEAQQTIQAKQYFSADEDGLTKQWKGRVWLNPPYAQPLIQQFIDKAVAEYAAGRMSECILLTHNYTDTKWFHAAVAQASAICFTRGRIKFISPRGQPLAAPTQGQAFFYFGNNTRKFAAEFTKHGFIASITNVGALEKAA